MVVILLIENLASVVNRIRICRTVNLWILRIQVGLLSFSANGSLSLTRVLSVVMRLWVLEVVRWIVLLGVLNLAFGHVISYHVSSSVDQLWFSLVLLGLVNATGCDTWNLLSILLSQCFLIHTVIHKFRFNLVLSFVILLDNRVLHNRHCSLLIWVRAIWSHLLLIVLIHRRSASRRRR